MVHSNCNICAKKTFFNRGEFLKAHGGKVDFAPVSPGISKITKKGDKNSPVFVYKLKCKVCGSDNSPNHKNNCVYYWESKPILVTEIFDGEEYGMGGFGVLDLNLESKMFFGKY